MPAVGMEADSSMPTLPEDRLIRILLVEEECLVRAALRKLLESWPEFEVVGESEHKKETLEMVARLDPDVILLTLPGNESHGLDVMSELVRVSERAHLLVLMGDSDTGLPIQVVRLGARGVVLKKRAAGELRKAILKVHEGKEIWLDRASLASLIAERPMGPKHTAKEESLMDSLTKRERDVIAQVNKGLKNREVGRSLLISETTVRHHLTSIFNKLKLRNRFELIAYLHRHRFSPSMEVAPLSRMPGTGART